MPKKNDQFYSQNWLMAGSLLLVIFCFLFWPSNIEAARIYTELSAPEIQAGDEFQVDFYLDTQNQQINALEGKINFTQDKLEFKNILDAKSLVNYWIEIPKQNNNKVIFSGGVVGGFSGEQGLVLSLIFKAKEVGIAEIDLHDILVLLNDGEGTPANMAFSSLRINISEKQTGVMNVRTRELIKEDTEMPEEFFPRLARHADLFDGKWFVAFSAWDKQSGISHYEVLESKTKEIKGRLWQEIENSPYVVIDQTLSSYIFIKAVDRFGNSRIAMIAPQESEGIFKYTLVIIILLVPVLVIGALVTFRKLIIRKS